MLNRDIYQLDPQQNRLENNGVAEVKDDQSAQALKTLRYELQTFVCDGEYEAGLDKILSAYLRNLGDGHEQPGVWISGFFGSGKSHLAKMLRALWTNQPFGDGVSARDIADLPQEIKDHFKELSIAAGRHGGLHAASGTLGAGANNNVRLALLNIIFKSAGLPEQYHQTRFVLWLKKEGILEQVKAQVEADDDVWEDELEDLYVSRSIARALMQADDTLASDVKEMRQLLKMQYPQANDVTNQQMVDAIHDALAQNGQFPLTLVVLDEVQQYVGDDTGKAHQVQEVVETCCKHSIFENKLLFVATGQSALSGMPNLQRLLGRFQIPIQLSDTDVESVIRKVILQKKPSAQSELDAVIKTNLGEISRQLRGTKIEHHQDDEQVMLADYPLLPVRRRFWEKVLRIVDTTGTASQLRNQLKVIHEAAQATADQPLGHVVPADFIYNQITVNLQQTGVISKEIAEAIGRLSAGDEDEQFKSRILALVLLIGKLPTDPTADCGVRATADMLADLLIDDLNSGKEAIRNRVPKLLQALADEGLVMPMETSVGTEYRLQTQESAQWYDTLRQEEADLRGNQQRIENIRVDLLHKELRQQIAQVRLTQGNCKEPRTVYPCFDPELPRDAADKIYAWVQDGWSVDEKHFLADARSRNPGEPTIFIHVPARNRSELNNAIVTEHAAQTTLDKRGMPNTDAGKDARTAMETRHRDAQKQVKTLLREIFDGVQVLQAGGNEVEGNSIAERIETAARASLVRLYRDFDQADHAGWGKVFDRAGKEGGQNALEAVGHSDEPEKHPVCAAIKRFIGVAKKGSEIREHFLAAPYGWPQDAIDGALFVLLASGILLAEDARSNPVAVTKLERKQITQTNFKPESITIRPVDLIKIRGLLTASGIENQPGEEAAKLPLLAEKGRELAQKAGGEAPLPAKPDTKLFDELARQSGNTQLKYALDEQDAIKQAIKAWAETAQRIEARRPEWTQLQELLALSKGLAFHGPIQTEVEAIIDQRSLLAEPNPVTGLIQQLVAKLREAIQFHVKAYLNRHAECLAQLQADSHWQQLDEPQQNQILAKRKLLTLDEPALNDAEAIIDSLNDVSLELWSERTDSLTGKFDSARVEAVELLQPKLQRINLPKTTFESEADLDTWLEQVKQQVLDKLNEGPVTF
ncbi:BREX system P-loop protein BrxC [Marinobacterium marinum]|uniref:BREX system P-loop protein BrxC n=1 Tax=Marinobacterium marinum TaxID=2756129 RepID=A0A7W1WVC0_9GAMM|nr:BREX system P-loop protein BrxC [Marinobacterium marinum]MBA4500884.1 BREX system P-loop protein BrxC [Marinobacterium marinum]